MAHRHDVLADAFERFTGYEYFDRPGFAFHGPMGAETLSTIGGDDLVAHWVEGYKARHEPLPAAMPSTRLDAADEPTWRAALGDPARVADWEALFHHQMQEMEWPAVVRAWAPMLIAGHGGGLTHGIIRVAHAVRALDGAPDAPTALRAELARGLAYWAATYKALPNPPTLQGSLDVASAVAALPHPPAPWAPMEAATFMRLGELEELPSALDALESPRSADPLGDLTEAFCRVVLATPPAGPLVPLVHTVTPVAAARMLQPLLPGVAITELYAQLWHVSAAVASSFSRWQPVAGDVEPSDLTPEEVLARAVAHGDTHAMKFAEACVREHAIRPSPIYLRAASHVLEALPTWEQVAA